jgi:mannose-6-phosphate isomerase-like protein (cupin superfamily)
MRNKVGFADAFKALAAEAGEFKTFLEHGTLSVELYQPEEVDKQSPHERDEVYVIASGRGRFILEGGETDVTAGDFLFVPAGASHRFVDFTPDFSTWVIFYGPKGGEGGALKNLLP